LRARGRAIDTQDYVWLLDRAGQHLFRPPNVAGWDDDRWLDTSTFRGRWMVANLVAESDLVDEDAPYDESEGPNLAVRRALGFWGNPTISRPTRRGLERYASAVEGVATEDWQQSTFRALRQNALRMLVATSPDMQTS
jgi:hypothetical protein